MCSTLNLVSEISVAVEAALPPHHRTGCRREPGPEGRPPKPRLPNQLFPAPESWMSTSALLRSRPRKQTDGSLAGKRAKIHTYRQQSQRWESMLQVGQYSPRPRGWFEFVRPPSNCRCLVDPSAWKQLAEPSATPFSPSAAHAGGEIGTTVTVDRWEGARWIVGKRRLCETSRIHIPRCCYWEEVGICRRRHHRQGRLDGGCEAQVSRLVLMPGGLRLRPGAHRLPPLLESATVREPHEVPHGMRSRVGPKCG